MLYFTGLQIDAVHALQWTLFFFFFPQRIFPFLKKCSGITSCGTKHIADITDFSSSRLLNALK